MDVVIQFVSSLFPESISDLADLFLCPSGRRERSGYAGYGSSGVAVGTSGSALRNTAPPGPGAPPLRPAPTPRAAGRHLVRFTRSPLTDARLVELLVCCLFCPLRPLRGT
ncbi:hypothetical protein EVAR_38796_1 [Eumeta japonica]|uniref:Uncharacterized protein n=1 Tax=Eumeta variegata TaxID=151549 RepID=A0A4C1WLM5_EUMVA|nr:hypothetical protein EVAR_38796_1 [Eumeta japonica]